MLRLNPLRGLDRPREVWAWGMYDLANQSFTLLIITLLFPIYFKEHLAPSEAVGDSVWSALGSTSLLVVVVLSPIIGALADARRLRKELLIATGLGSASLTACLAIPPLAQHPMVLPAACFFLANIFFQLGENLLASFLSDIASPRNVGRVSATGWAMGYAGALVLLLLTAGAITRFSWTVADWPPLFVFAGLWFALGIIPAALILRERRRRLDAISTRSAIHESFARLAQTARDAARYRQLARFLIAYFVFWMGVQTIIYFAGILASDFGFTQTKLVLFMLQLTLTAGIAAVLTGVYQDRLGGLRTISIFLGLWILTACAMLALTLLPRPPEAMFWIIGNAVGLAIGGIGTASRALVARFTPEHKSAEFFGFWGTTGKLAGVVGVLTFGQTKAWIGAPAAMLVLLAFFVIGLLLLLRVSEFSGLRVARRAGRRPGTPA